MERERRIPGHHDGRAEAGEASAEGLDSHAAAMWAYAADCDRWGLCTDAAVARRRTIEMRVRALLSRALLLGDLGTAEEGDPA